MQKSGEKTKYCCNKKNNIIVIYLMLKTRRLKNQQAW